MLKAASMFREHTSIMAVYDQLYDLKLSVAGFLLHQASDVSGYCRTRFAAEHKFLTWPSQLLEIALSATKLHLNVAFAEDAKQNLSTAPRPVPNTTR